MQSRLFRYFVTATFCFLLSGCVSESMGDDGTASFGYEWWVSVLAIFGGIGGVLAGIALIENRFGWLLLAGGAFFAIVWGPASFTEYVTIDATGFRSAGGFWGFTKHDVKYEEMSGITYSKKEKSGRRGRKYNVYSITMNRKSGDSVEMEIDNLMEHAGVPLIMVARLNGVPFSDLTGELHSSDEIDQLLQGSLMNDDNQEVEPAP